jgi:KaiC/GvpD/RAD55 family RecA-like ATPase
MRRVPTGIKGFDELVDGGFPEGSPILISGNAGAGKSIFAYHFIYNGAKMYNEPGIVISLEEPVENIIENMRSIGMEDVENLIKEKKMAIFKVTIFNFEEFKEAVRRAVKTYKAKRLVIDSSSVLSLFFEAPFQIRTGIVELINFLREFGCTTLLTSEIEAESRRYSTFGVEEYVVDGILLLFHKMVGNMFVRAMTIVKLRRTKHSELVYPFRIDRHGLRIYPEEALPEKFI